MFVGIIGGGGGLRGASEIGWLEDLLPYLIYTKRATIKYLGGVSVGALITGKLAEAQTPEDLLQRLREIKQIFLKIDREGPETVFPFDKLTLPKSVHKRSLLDGATLRKLVNDPLDNGRPLDVTAIVQSPFQYDACAMNELTGQQEIFSNRDERVRKNHVLLREAIVASASISPFFPEVTINGIPYSDGMYINLARAIDAGCDTIFVLLPYREDGKEAAPADLISRIFPWIPRTFFRTSAMARERDRVEIEWARRIAQNIRVDQETREKADQVLRWSTKKQRVQRILMEAPFTFKNKLDVTIHPIYIETELHTLKMYTFRKGDIPRIMDQCREAMRHYREQHGLV